MILAKSISVELGDTPIVHGIDFAAKAGQVTAILGPNGSGKTTLLKALIGELDYAGECQMNGMEVSQMSVVELAQQRGVLAQFSHVAFPFTVFEVVSLGIMASGKEDRLTYTNERVEESLDMVGLPGFSGRFYAELSGGEQQRVHLARVLCQIWEPEVDGSPRWLFLDEPVASLDVQYQLKIMDIARQFAQKGGGVIAIMHDLNLSAMFADQLALLCEGRILAQGPPHKVLTNKNLKKAFHCDLKGRHTPKNNSFYVLPQSVEMQK